MSFVCLVNISATQPYLGLVGGGALGGGGGVINASHITEILIYEPFSTIMTTYTLQYYDNN